MTDWHLGGELNFTVGQCSEAGIKADNEDAIGIRIPKGNLLSTKGAVAVIADGVSAAEAGKEASETCVKNFLSDYYSTPDTWTVKNSAAKVLIALNRWLFGQGRHFTDANKGFVSTFSCIIFKSHAAYLFHVGDSRIYRLRNGDLEQLTRDHSTFISSEQSYLSRAMGLDVSLDVDCRSIDVDINDVFFLSTDGIHDFLKAEDIRSHLVDVAGKAADIDFEQCCKNLIKQALASNSNDNVSCQIVRVDSLPQQNIDDVCKKLTELPFPPELDVGMTLDGFKVERQLYGSNRSQIYLVKDVETGSRYCMKTPSVNYEDDPSYIERFAMESWIGGRINNSHVVKVVEFDRSKSCLYYLTEYIDGMTLGQWMKENPKPPVQEVVFLLDQIAKGLRAFHRKETLHQDIKPDNIVIDKNGVVKIIDFGACLVAGVAEISTPIERDTVLGTASYSAPEHILLYKSGYQVDIFSLAVICFEMLTGVLPFSGKLEACKTRQDFLNTKYIPSYHLNPLVPVWVDGAIRKSLRFIPERRHNDVSEFIYELKNPNPKYLEKSFQPIIERDPLLFWQCLVATLVLTQVLSLWLLLK
jgi:serine/threonine protein phosphatase PrpC